MVIKAVQSGGQKSKGLQVFWQWVVLRVSLFLSKEGAVLLRSSECELLEVFETSSVSELKALN